MGLYEDIDDPDSKYYFNLETNTVEKGLVSDWTHRMGPYETEEVARAALDKAPNAARSGTKTTRSGTADRMSTSGGIRSQDR